MRKQEFSKTLVLRKETIAQLDRDEMRPVKGGLIITIFGGPCATIITATTIGGTSACN